ncbi:hypothetical protein [Microbacterium sp. A84]|uniref:hypothetical protein n=1 Tax=Microbacterium sp. A84 TaxID=3450715 RepID=UPI003F443639
MSESTSVTSNRAHHLIALAAGVFALLFFIFGPVVFGGLLAVLVGVAALIIGHRASARPGRIRWVAILGLVIAYLQLITAGGILLVGALRVLGAL